MQFIEENCRIVEDNNVLDPEVFRCTRQLQMCVRQPFTDQVFSSKCCEKPKKNLTGGFARVPGVPSLGSANDVSTSAFP